MMTPWKWRTPSEGQKQMHDAFFGLDVSAPSTLFKIGIMIDTPDKVISNVDTIGSDADGVADNIRLLLKAYPEARSFNFMLMPIK